MDVGLLYVPACACSTACIAAIYAGTGLDMPSSSSTLELPVGMKGKVPSKGLPSALGMFGMAAAPIAKTARETYEVSMVEGMKDSDSL